MTNDPSNPPKTIESSNDPPMTIDLSNDPSIKSLNDPKNWPIIDMCKWWSSDQVTLNAHGIGGK